MNPTLYAEYRSGLDAMGRGEWVALKNKLCGNNPDETLVLFKNYVAAWLERQRADEELEEYIEYRGPDTTLHMECWERQKGLMNVSHYALRTERQTYYDLSVAVLGDDVFWANPAEETDTDDELNYTEDTDE